MIIGPSLRPASVAALARAGGGAVAEQKSLPAGLFDAATAGFDDMTDWTLDPDWSAITSAVQKVAGTTSRFVTSADLTIPSGDIWASFTVRDATAGTVGVQLQGPFANNPFSTRLAAQHVARFASAGHIRTRLNANSTFDGTIDDYQLVDMSAILAQPADIYIAAGQSQIACESSGGDIDPDKDFWVDRCLYMPGSTNSALGAVFGEVHACVAPLQMGAVSTGVSPATTFAREIEKSTAAGRSVMILACAQGGTRLIGADAEWNPAGSTGAGATLYNKMVSMAGTALALNAGNQIKALIWGQGESDRGPSMDTTYPPAFTSLLSNLRSDLSLPGLPVILIGPEPDDTNTNQALFIDTQEKLDEDSGDATALTGVHYVARPSGYLSGDGTHPVAEGHRIAGRLAAARYVAEGYS